MEDILYCLSRRPNLEWSGLLFWKINEDADLENPESIKITVDKMHLQDLGSGTYTEFDNDGVEIIDLYDQYPELMDMRCGLIHSHHTMKAFFSPTDQEELHEKALNGMYFSLIVNNHMQPCAKLCWTGESEIESEITRWEGGWNLGSMFNRVGVKKTETVKELSRTYYEIEFEIEFPETISVIADRFEELDEKDIRKQAMKIGSQQGYRGVQSSLNSIHGGMRSTAGFQIPEKSIPGSQQSLFGGSREEREEDKSYQAWAKSQEEIPGQQIKSDEIWKGLKANGLEEAAFSSFLVGEISDEPFYNLMTELVNQIKEDVEEDQALYRGSRNFAQQYEDDCLTRAEEIISEGDTIVAELAGQFYMEEEDYKSFLIDLMKKLEKSKGILNSAFREAIKATVLEVEDDEEMINEISS